ncbi:DUF4041 domain-containing protein [Veillonella caviae]|uniref:DUF4041 domain-containing protein n=1 Tax=Veillonella caviae TaxID=248316 RepID=UPI0023F53B8D|nr:DUF4041 domain-containing protein [Veillonella caviae]MCI6407910.1 DUF4041 domain-containing protein [Veillonella caviae]MDY4745636.1 DUF4041 domain-containing protein [Veillonella caviae]MDY6224671.1 DUF4041 domain-containing protein [Veillonella caviae]
MDGEKRFLTADIAIFIISSISIFWPYLLILLAIVIIARYKKWSLIENDIYNKHIKNQDLERAISAKKTTLDNLENTLKREKADIEKAIQRNLDIAQDKVNNLNSTITTKQAEINFLKNEIETIEKVYTSVVVDTSSLELLQSQELKNVISQYKLKESEMIKNDEAVQLLSFTENKKFITNQTRQLLRSFNAECDITINNITIKNIDSMRNKIIKSYESLNKLFESDKVQIRKEYLENKLQQLVSAHLYQVKLEDEREQKKIIQDQLKEEEKVRREIERQKAKIEKDETQFKNEIAKLMKYLQKTDNDVEKNLYIDKIKECEDKLSELEEVKSDVLNREQNTRAGFVYIISNIGSFGENVFKIGMTRRLEPMDRIKELSSASVPFEFDVHAMIFSDDAPTLENTLHTTFRDYEVNKVNHRKEFFNIPLEEIEKVVTENHNATVKWSYDAPAEEYRESITQ